MTSIVDDFTDIYNEITNDIIEKKKEACNNGNDFGYNCDNIYNITENDIVIRLNTKYYSNNNILSYKTSIINTAKIFNKNNLYDSNDENSESRVYKTHINTKISSFKSTRNNYRTLDNLLLWIQIFIMGFLIKRYIWDFMFEDKTVNLKNKEESIETAGDNTNNKTIGSRVKAKLTKIRTSQQEGAIKYLAGKTKLDVCKLDQYILTGIPVISIVWLTFDFIRNIFKTRENELNTNIKKLEDILNSEIDTMIRYINELDNIDISDDEFRLSIKNIIGHYQEIQNKNLTNNRYSKNQKIKSMNEFFDEIKQIVLINDNKFTDIVIDNQDQVICLMKLITHEGNNEGTDCLNDNTTVCQLNVDCGFRGVMENQYLKYRNVIEDDVVNKNNFKNGLDEIIDASDSKITDFFNNIQTKVIDSSIQFSIKNSPVFKIINNIFILKIKYYGITKIQFFKYIYKYFSNYKSNNNVNKQDMINNYKTLINMIYENYTTYDNINHNNKYLANNLISKHRFSEIINKYNTDELSRMILKLEKTIKEIEDFKNIYKEDINQEIEIHKKQNKNFFNLFVVIFLSSIMKSIGFILQLLEDEDCNKNENKKTTFTIQVLKILTIVTLVILLNSIIYSYWFKKSVDIKFKESIILDSNNKFTTKLHDMHKYLKYVNEIKKLDINNVDTLINIFDKFNIKYLKYDNPDTNTKVLLFSKYNSGDNYTILHKNDLSNIINEQLYFKINDVIKLYECCSFLKEAEKKVILPYQEISLNIIFIIITIVVFMYIFSDSTLNPIYLFDNIINTRKELFLYGEINTNRLRYNIKKIKQTGGYNDDIGMNLRGSTLNIIYIVIIYLSIKFIELLYTSNIEYEKSLYQ
jgi:hypothetical protein